MIYLQKFRFFVYLPLYVSRSYLNTLSSGPSPTNICPFTMIDPLIVPFSQSSLAP